MTNYAPRKLRASVEKKNGSTTAHRITLNREVHLSDELKHWLGRVANDGLTECLVSVLQTDKTVIEVSINRGPSNDPAVAFKKVCKIITEIATSLNVTPQNVTVVYLSGRIEAMTLSDMDDLVTRLDNPVPEQQPQRRLHAMS